MVKQQKKTTLPKPSFLSKKKETERQNKISLWIKTFITNMSSPFLAELIVQEDHDLLFQCRTDGVKLKPQNDADFTQEELSEIKSALVVRLKARQSLLFPNQPRVNLLSMVSHGIPFLKYLSVRNLKPNALSPFLETEFGKQTVLRAAIYRIMNQLQKACVIPSIMWSSYEKGFCRIEAGFIPQISEGTKTLTFFITRLHPPCQMFRLRSNSREAFRVTNLHPTNVSLIYQSITPEELGIHHAFPKKRLPVYIQRHALNRMYERLDCVNPSMLLPTIYSSIHNSSAIIINNKRVLLAVTLADIKVGYFLASVENEALLIRTFLFITASGTPEGNLLTKITGLQKLDIKHLNLDKLSSFVTENVTENEQIKSIFEKAGCGYLFSTSLTRFSAAEFLYKHTPAEKLPDYIADNRWDVPYAHEPTNRQQPWIKKSSHRNAARD